MGCLLNLFAMAIYASTNHNTHFITTSTCLQALSSFVISSHLYINYFCIWILIPYQKPCLNYIHQCSYGLPKLSSVPNGYSALAEIYGKGANRSPLLVAFGFPIDWVVTLPSQDVNGEDGTIQAGEYAKGDTATFFVVPNEKKVEVSILSIGRVRTFIIR